MNQGINKHFSREAKIMLFSVILILIAGLSAALIIPSFQQLSKTEPKNETTEVEDPYPTYPAHLNACNLSCNFPDNEFIVNCAADAETKKYIKKLLHEPSLLNGPSLKEYGQDACICMQANLNQKGYFSEVSVLKSNYPEVNAKYIKHIEQARFIQVPESASCLLDKQANPVYLSFDALDH